MGDRVRNPETVEIPEKSESLDGQSAPAGKSRAQNGQENRVMKRKSWVRNKSESSFLQEKRRKGRKEVSLSSIEDSTKKSGSLDSRDLNFNAFGLKLSSIALFEKNPVGRKRTEDGTNIQEEKFQTLRSLDDLSHSLDDNKDNVIVIPKRPRGFSGRNKFQTVNSGSRREISRPPTSKDNSGAEFSRSKLIGVRKEPVQAFLDKRKRILDKVKGNRTNSNSVSQFKHEDIDPVQSGSPAPKRARRLRLREKKYDGEKQTQEDKRPLLDPSINSIENSQENDEENLEQNAARMLSSRFDPSCTGFSGRGAALKSQSADGLSLSPFLQRAYKSLGKDASMGSETAGRKLRPRNQQIQKGFFKRQRRHFYEVCYLDMDPYWVVNQRIKVFWPLDQSWYYGIVKAYDTVTKSHHIKYDDRDEEWINLQNERFKLLLLPDEVRGKSYPEKRGRERRLLQEDVDANFMDENCMGNFTESEPIISWLSRSTLRVKSSSHDIMKKQKQSHVSKNSPQHIFSENSVEMPNGCSDIGPSSSGTSKLFVSSEVRSVIREVAEKSLEESGTCSSDRKMPLVYFRRRFRNRRQGSGNILEESACRSVDNSVTLLALVIDKVGPLDEFDIALQSSSIKDLKLAEKDSSSMSLENLMSKLPGSSTKSEINLMLSLPPLRVLDLAFGAENFWLYHMLLLFKYGKLTTVWPSVRVEMLFVDNIVGLRFMLFEGCLNQAVAFLCYIMAVFYRPKEHGLLEDFQFPVTSIRFKLLGLQGIGRLLEFVFYNFLELKNSKWAHLDRKLKQHCIISKELPLSECTYANIKTIQSGSDKIPVSPVCEVPVSLQKKSRRSIMCRNCSSCKFDGKLRRLPPLVLSFAAAPTFFLSLHLNLLIANNVASGNLQNHDLMSLRERLEGFPKLVGDGGSLVGDSLDLDSETMFENMRCSLSCDAASIGWVSNVNRKLEAVAPSVGDDGNWMKTCQESLHGELDVCGATVGCRGPGKSQSDMNVAGHEICPCHSGSRRSVGTCSSVPDRSFPETANGCISLFNDSDIQSSSSVDVEDQPLDHPAQVAKTSANNLGARNMIEGNVYNPNPTAPRSMWHRSRHGSVSSSFGYRSKLWPDFISNDFVNGSRKPRTQVSSLLPFGGYNLGSKPRSHRRKGHTYKRISNENAKASDGAGGPQRYLESLCCDANVLVTVSDRGWRERGAQVVLESVDHKDWRLLVKISGVTKYSHKAHQFLQPGPTNKYTHAMTWKGGKDWILEFPDRRRWALFKEMHEECYNRNIRAASVKNIPIPGVRLIEDSDECTVEVPFIRSPKYFRQIGTDVDMAMDPSRVFYDMENDDEDWFSKFKSSSDTNGTNPPEITEEIFERVMDLFEKVAYAQQCENFTSDEIEHFMVGIGPIDAIKAIYDYWQQKRLKKGMPLIRHLQPALWERYQQQLKEWDAVMSRTQNSSNGFTEKATLVEKPPMFAFCLRPRGLEVPNKGTKQRSHRKFTVLGHHGGVSRDSDGLHVNGRKFNGFAVGDEKALVTYQNYASSDVSPRLQTSSKLSPRDASGLGNLSMSSDWSGRNQYPKLQRNKSKKSGMHLSPRKALTASMPFYQRTTEKRNGDCQWNNASPEYHSLKRSQLDGFQRHRGDQLGGPDFDEFRLRDASGAAQHALNMAKLKRERAHRLLFKADLAMHKAVVALMTAEAIRASERESNVDE
eukprot:TRINITY_DN2187_c0_g1_i1.p1 TRINITY_DN2187_c0_g1~~TRINITY_DN2187_c0_g1_i1.p1  ORF type:complete len:1691 (+),score=369.43 TRINITY_DN2187_c0_g1_i1:296-5368(+)